MSDGLHARVDHDLTNHPPRTAAVAALMDEALRQRRRLLAAGIARNQDRVPGGPDR